MQTLSDEVVDERSAATTSVEDASAHHVLREQIDPFWKQVAADGVPAKELGVLERVFPMRSVTVRAGARRTVGAKRKHTLGHEDYASRIGCRVDPPKRTVAEVAS